MKTIFETHGENEKLEQPPNSIPRHRCLIYGFGNPIQGLMGDQGDNHCPLLNKPCAMEGHGITPDFERCPDVMTAEYSESSRIVEIQGSRLCPREFAPQGISVWGGVSPRAFEDYVMRPDTPRPAPKSQ
ncbi:MAG: hypothetical protein AAB861_02200 [Patescibacteria group bacterium]